MTQLAPSIQDGLIYLLLGGRTLTALQDQGNAAGLIWQSDLPFNATSSMTIWLDTIFIGSGDGGDARLVAMRRADPNDRREFVEPNGRVQQPAIGQETIFVGADRLWAVDINLFAGQEIVWTSPDVFDVAAPPVYVAPGVMRLAELYVADNSGTVHALDANTGARFWTHTFGASITSLAVNDSSVFIAGNGVLRAISRRDGATQWTLPVGGTVMGGPLVTNSRALVVTESGGIFLIDAVNGSTLDADQCAGECARRTGGERSATAGPCLQYHSLRLSRRAMNEHTRRPGWDSLLVAVLVFALLQITGLAEQAALPTRLQDVLRHPILGSLLPPAGIAAMGDADPRPGDPIGLLLFALSLLLLLLYLLFDLLLADPWRSRIKAVILGGLLATVVLLPMTKLILLRQGSGPASYTHDGGVIQTEATIRYLLEGKNPYVEDYVNTPMAEWGISRYRTALYHYPYLPWTFVFSAPFYLLGQALGFYDQRIVYAGLWIVALACAPRLATGAQRKLALVALLGLNPLMGLDIIFGQNDVFVLSWLLLALVTLPALTLSPSHLRTFSWSLAASTLFFGLACAAKPTAWFLAPFYGLLLLGDHDLAALTWRARLRLLPLLFRRALPAILVFALLVGPYVIWNAGALYDDVWRWSTGQGETGYQIWGWGASNFVLALGWVSDRFGQWPFWLTELLVAGPLLAWFLWRQLRDNTLANACWHYGLLLFGFLYASRFLNENYLGFLLAFLAVGMLADRGQDRLLRDC